MRIIVIAMIAACTLAACTKEGTGGEAAISAYVKHHNLPIPGSKVYIKYGAKEFPGAEPGLYDDSKVADVNAHVQFDGLERGDYYLYGTGFDSTIMMPVTGGTTVKISKSDKSGTVEVLVPVIE